MRTGTSRRAIVTPVNRRDIARQRRRQSIEAMLELEVERESILRERFADTIGDADLWKVDAEVLAGFPSDQVALLERMLLVEEEPDADAKERYEEDIREQREDIVECERRQQALRDFLDALGQ